jgi:hypothetical protein
VLCLGIDPDLHDLAIASWDDQGPVRGHVVSVPRSYVGGEAVLKMMQELSAPWPDFARPHITRDVHFPEFCAVEGQELARSGPKRHARPQDIVTLGQVAGMSIMRVARGFLHGCSIYFPKPSEWKGSVPKYAMQARLYTELDWPFAFRGNGTSKYAFPKDSPGFEHFTHGQWKHLGDALLLARWCWEQANGRKWSRAA